MGVKTARYIFKWNLLLFHLNSPQMQFGNKVGPEDLPVLLLKWHPLECPIIKIVNNGLRCVRLSALSYLLVFFTVAFIWKPGPLISRMKHLAKRRDVSSLTGLVQTCEPPQQLLFSCPCWAIQVEKHYWVCDCSGCLFLSRNYVHS